MPEEQVTETEVEAPVTDEAPATEVAEAAEAVEAVEVAAVEDAASADEEVVEVPAEETEEVAEVEAPAADAADAEVAEVVEAPAPVEEATFSAEEVATAVREEIAAATSRIQAEMQAKVDALEIQVANEKARADEIAAEFASYKDELAAAEQAVSVRETRIAAAKAANPNLADDFFTEERAASYAAMPEGLFTTVVLDALANAYASGPHAFAQPDETADDLDVCAVCSKDAATHTVQPRTDESAAHTTTTSAFTGGKTPTGLGSAVTPTSRLLSAKRAQATTS